MIAIYPYDSLVGDVRLTVSKVAIDGKALSMAYINSDVPEIAFRDIDSDGWTEATIDVVVTAPAGELDGSTTWTDACAVVQVLCSYSNTRLAVPLKPDRHTPARWTGTVQLGRETCYGRATLKALLPATVDGVPHRVIGVSETWALSFDDLPPSPVHGSIAVQWVNFAVDESLGLAEYNDDPHHLRLDPEAPALYLNSGFKGLEPLLGDRKRRAPAEQAMHDSTRGKIAGDAWFAMFETALDAVETDPDTGMPEWPAEEWRVVVLKTLFQRIYPDLGPDDALIEAKAARRFGNGFGDLLERLLPAAARQVGTSRLLRKGIDLLQNPDTKGAAL